MLVNPLDVATIVVDLAAGAGSTEVKAAVAGQRWCVVQAHLVAAANSTVIVLSAAVALTGTIPILTTNPLLVGNSESVVWVAPVAGTALNIDPGAGDVDGWVNVVMLK